MRSDRVTFTDEAADALKSSVRQMQATLRRTYANAVVLGQELSIGETPAAKVYKLFLAAIATDPHQGLVPVLQKMQQDAEDIIAAVDMSARSTQGTDEGNAADMEGNSC